jgi:hypothetical protein
MLRLSLKAKLLAASTVIALGAVGVGIAAWSTSGSGTAYAGAATASPLTLGDLYPGATGALRLEVTNPNAFPVLITAVSGNGAITSDAGAACNAGHGVTLVSQSGLSLPLAAGATTTFALAGAVSMSTSSVTSCQGAVFSIPVTVTAASA